jgi:hypothetical protein
MLTMYFEVVYIGKENVKNILKTAIYCETVTKNC